jgi:hypothetical protein
VQQCAATILTTEGMACHAPTVGASRGIQWLFKNIQEAFAAEFE